MKRAEELLRTIQLQAVETAPTHLTTHDSDLREFPGGELWHRGPTTGSAWIRLPAGAFLAVVEYAEMTS